MSQPATPSKRIKGVALMLKIGTPPIDYFADVTSAVIEPVDAEDDVLTFKDVQDGNTSDYMLKLGFIQSTTPSGLWRYIWDNAGQEIPFTLAPHGNEVPSEDEPHFVGTVTIGSPPPIGGEASRTGTYTAESEWKITGKPALVTTAG